MLSLVLFVTFGSSARAQDDIGELIGPENEESVTSLLDEIQNSEATLPTEDKEIEALPALAVNASSEANTGPSIAEALTLRDEAIKARDEARAKLGAVSRSMKSRIRELEEAQATLQSDSIAKDAEIANLQVELTRTQESTLRDRLTLAYNLACIYKAAREYTKAETEFMKALELAPDDPGVHYNLGILYDDNLDNSRKALVHYQRFLELAPHDTDAPKVIEWMSSLH